MIRVVNKRNYSGPGENIGRPSPLGNPWSHKPSKYAIILVKSTREAIDKFRDWIESEPENLPDKTPEEKELKRLLILAKKELQRLVEIYKSTKELVLICWCVPADCHGFVIADIIHEIVRDLT